MKLEQSDFRTVTGTLALHPVTARAQLFALQVTAATVAMSPEMTTIAFMAPAL
jgi:hypothetical protein